MNAKKILVSLLVIASVLVLTSMVSASSELASFTSHNVNGVIVNAPNAGEKIEVIAGEMIPVRVVFVALEDASNVRMEVSIRGEKSTQSSRTAPFDVESGKTYTRVLNVRVPFDLKDEVSEETKLKIEIWNNDYESEDEVTLNAQRPSYNANVAFVNVKGAVEAGETLPVEVVIKNRGYNRLDDVLITVGIPALGVSRSAFLGRIVAVRNCSGDCDEDEDTVSGKIYLEVPFEAEAGLYALEVEVQNEDTVSSVVKELVIKNEFSNVVIPTSTKKTVGVGQTADFEMVIVNPTNKLVVYTIVPQSGEGVSSSTSESVFAVPAGSSRNVKVSASADSEGTHNFDVNVLSGSNLVGKSRFTLETEGSSVANPIVVLTVILAIVFLVLLVVLIVLLGKKPQKTEEFGESYY
jgi:hypothetical protein